MENWARFFFTTITNSNEYLNQQQCLAADKFRRTSKTPDVTSRNNNNTNEDKNKNYNFKYLLLRYRVFASHY